jgi:antitoxin component of MazEF toxin-antitoxin module
MGIGRSRCITLPPDFADGLEVKKGEEVYIDLAGRIILVTKPESIKGKEPVSTIIKLLSDIIKISARLDEEWEKYKNGKVSIFEVGSNIGEARDRLVEIGSSIKRLSTEKVEPVKKKLKISFLDDQVSVTDIVNGIEALRMEAYEEALDALCSEIETMVEEEKTMNRVLERFDKDIQEYDQHAMKNLTLTKLRFKQKMHLIDKTLRRIKSLIQAY